MKPACASRILQLLLLIALPAMVQGQFTYTTNNGAITIIGYTGSGGAATIPNSTNGYPVTSIGDSAFAWSMLSSLTIPNSVTNIGNRAFWYCSSLTNVAIPNSVVSIGDSAFYECSSLTSVTIGNGVTNIGDSAFCYCSHLTSLTMGNSVINVGNSAFYDCYNLTGVAIPSSVINIASSAFDWCYSLTAITVETNNPVYSSSAGVLFNRSQTTLLRYPGGKLWTYVIPNGVTKIGDHAFYDSYNLTAITIPSSVTNIGVGAFSWCDRLNGITVDALNPVYMDMDGVLFNKSRSTLIAYPGGRAGAYVVPNSVTSIGDYAFYECTSLTNVMMPDSVTNIGAWAFERTRLISVVIPDSIVAIGDNAFCNCFWLTGVTIGNGVISLGSGAFDSCYSLSSLTIPSNVTSIGDYGFASCSNLRSVIIPNSVTNIGSGAFASCTSLANVALPKSVISIGSYQFWNCSSLTNVTLSDSVATIGEHAFEYCTALTTAPLDNGVILIGDSAFSDCTNLTGVAMGHSVTSVGPSAFDSCSNLRSVVIPNGVTNIGSGAFAACTSLTNALLGDSVISIGDNAFTSCSSLTTVRIPSSVNDIGSGAFSYCTNLTSVRISSSVTSIGDYGFYSCTKLLGVYFEGDAPNVGLAVFDFDYNATVYYMSWTTGWGPKFGCLPTTTADPVIERQPEDQFVFAGGNVSFTLDAIGASPLSYQWRHNGTNIWSSVGPALNLSNVQPAQGGTYSVVVSNSYGIAVTSNALLTVIEPTVVSVWDPNLEVAIRSTLGKTNGPLTSLDMQSLTYLYASYRGITNLTGLEWATRLTTLYLQGNSISNLEVLHGLYRLNSLGLDNNQVSDVSPLAGLTNLAYLSLNYNPTANCAQLAGFTNLTSLYLSGNSISNLTFLHGLYRLNSLGLDNNQLSDLSSLAGLTNLIYLSLNYNPTANFAPLAGLTNLYNLSLNGNSISNLSFVQGLTRLTTLYLNQNRLGDITALAGLTNLYGIDVSWNHLTNINALTNMPHLNWVYVQGNLLDLSLGSAAMNVITSLQGKGVNVNYLPQNQPPTISVPINWIIPANETSSLGLSVWDDETSQDHLILSAHSSNTGLISDANIVIQGTNAFPKPYPFWQWSLNLTPSMNQTGTTTITLTATDDTGLSTNASFLVTVLMPLAFDGQVVNCSNWVWSTFGTTPWFGQINVSHDGHAAAQSGSPESWLETTVTGPGVLTFWWKSSGTNSYWPGGYFTAACASSGLSGSSWLYEGTDWRKEIVSLPAGSWVLRWQGSDPGTLSDLTSTWLDEVSFVPGPTVCWLEVGPAAFPPLPPGYFWLDLHGEIGAVYDLEVSSNLQNWSPLTRLSFDNFDYWFNDSNSTATGRFYRLHKVIPLWLEIVGRPGGGQCQLILHGEPATAYQILASTNLATWSTLATVTNTLGRLPWTDAMPTNSPQRFYRAQQVP